MVDVNPEIWNNPTLGAQEIPFLDEIEAQELENSSAAAEGRIARIARRKSRHPGAPIEEQAIEFTDSPTGQRRAKDSK